MNITISEWDIRVIENVLKVRTRWPWIDVEVRKGDGLHLHTESCSAMLGLRSCNREMLVPHVHFTSGKSLVGKVSEVERGIADFRAVADVLHFLAHDTDRLKIWIEGTCPCDSCGSTGEVKGETCPVCEGKKVR